MNILLIAPDLPHINSIPEIRAISGAHRTHVLNGVVTSQNIHEAVTHNQYNAIHFATHIEQELLALDKIQLSNGESLDLNSATRLAKMGGAQLIVFNICLAARFATYMVRNGIPCVIYTTITIEDKTAWELPSAFYEQCRRFEQAKKPLDYPAIFEMVDDGGGTYGLLCGPGYELGQMQKGMLPVLEMIAMLQSQVSDMAIQVTTMGGRLSGIEHSSRGGRNPTWVVYLALVIAGVIALSVAALAIRTFL